MKLNSKLVAQMRAATQALLGKGPVAATAAIQEALNNASAVQQSTNPMRDINPPPAPELASNQPSYDPSRVAEEIVPEMLAKLGRMGDTTGLFRAPGDISGLFRTPGDTTSLFRMPGVRTPETPPLPGTFSDHSHTNAAGTRTYKLYVPSTYESGRAALIVMLHGCTQDPDDFAVGTGMNVLAEETGCLVVYPAQSMQANASRCWNWFNAVDQQRDQGEPSIIAGITRDVMAQHAVDPAQVYVAGLSAGGAMATIMGTLYPDLYAAVGVHSGLPFAAAHDLPSALAAMKGDFKRRNKPGQALPIIVFHGDRDTTVHPSNADGLIEHARDESHEVAIEPGRVPDGHAYTRTMHQRPDGRVHAEHWVIHGAGHAWSGGNANGSYTDGKGPNASREMIRFFKTHK
jgi:poly(hydroxyalkanoate) depolymerase family esterase